MKNLTGLLVLLVSLCANAFGAQLTLNKGDHICYLGNALADRMQHDAWLETLLYSRFPRLDLVFRNLAASGDEVATWHRSENFGSRDDWLTKTKADVIFAFYGFNESFQGGDGLDKFKSDLDKFLKETKAKDYSGKGAPRLVLFSASVVAGMEQGFVAGEPVGGSCRPCSRCHSGGRGPGRWRVSASARGSSGRARRFPRRASVPKSPAG